LQSSPQLDEERSGLEVGHGDESDVVGSSWIVTLWIGMVKEDPEQMAIIYIELVF